MAILIAVSICNFLFGQSLYAASNKRKGWLLSVGIICNVGILFYFKYANFFLSNINQALSTSFDISHIVIPIGISFYIFQVISYLIDIYLDKIFPQRHLGYFLLYLAFFPKLLQGPIERAKDLLVELKKPFINNPSNNLQAFKWIVIGYFYKMVIADRLGLLCDPIFADVSSYEGLALLTAVYLYTLQIYFDFAGYTSIARGVALLFGIRLSENFNHPFGATNIQEFWRRWHITFSSWLRDYLFMPLVASFRNWGAVGIVLATMLTFFIAGLWHGPTWGFICFGLIHGVYLSVSALTLKSRDKWIKQRKLPIDLINIFRRIILFQMVAFSFIFFRSVNISDAWQLIQNMMTGMNLSQLAAVLPDWQVVLLILSFLLLNWQSRIEGQKVKSIEERWFYAVVINLIIFLGVTNSGSFIYFQF